MCNIFQLNISVMLPSHSFIITFPFLILCIILIKLPGTEGINCFVCNSRNEPYCEFLVRNDSQAYLYDAPCNEFTETGDPPFCRKIVQYIKDYDIYRVVRKCGYRRHHKDCYTVRNADHEETVCQCFEDGCNSSSSTSASILILSLSIFGVALKTLY